MGFFQEEKARRGEPGCFASMAFDQDNGEH
jgi:hypothetical protein